MSVRIYELSKQLRIENRALIALLQKRGFAVTRASSSIDEVSANALLKEYKGKQSPQKTALTPTAASSVVKEELSTSSKFQLPPGIFVKSKEEVSRERNLKAPVGTRPTKPLAPLSSGTPRSFTSSALLKPISYTQRPLSRESERKTTASAVSSIATSNQPDKRLTAPSSEPIASGPTTVSDKTSLKPLRVKSPIIVRDFAALIGIKPFRLISELMERGIFASMNQVIEEKVALKIAEKYGRALEIKHRGQRQQEPEQASKTIPPPKPEHLEPRPPVVCILGHVDHGKTTLLDTIRKTKVVSQEAGRITQHIGAYQVEHGGKKITFIDTPGHAAFSKMRQRGTDVTDIAVLVIAAEDGFKSQTEEALKFAQRAGVPVVVAINKIDVHGADIDNVKRQLQKKGIASEDWGGDTLTVEISALKGEKIQDLLEAILLQSEIMDLKAAPKSPAAGIIVETRLDVGRGPAASVIIQKGTLKVGDALVCGSAYCKVRAMLNDQGKPLKEAPPSTPIHIIGWSKLPEVGAICKKVENEKVARRLCKELFADEKRKGLWKQPEVATKDALIDLMNQREDNSLKIILKSDVQGSLEALASCLEAIKSDKVALDIVAGDIGSITKTDVSHAAATHAIIVGFNVKQENGVAGLAKHHGVRILQNNIIYEIIDQVKEAMVDLIGPEIKTTFIGSAEVRNVFPIAKGTVAGCKVLEGKVKREALARLMRGDTLIQETRIDTLKRFKEDVTEVRSGYECGIHLAGVNHYEAGDRIECFERNEVKAQL